MSETEQDLQRREQIFRVLDDMKSRGERINADKVARLAKMGKQTILPYYKEWRFLDDVDREQQEELPEDLVRILKRGIAKWKHSLAEGAQAFAEQANTEIDNLKQTISRLQDLEHERERSISTLTEQLEACQTLSTQTIEDNHLKDQQIASLKAQMLALEDKNKEAQTTIEQQKKEYAEQSQQLEKKLDERHQEQLNHWITVVDNERRQKQNLEKQLNKFHEQLLSVEKEKSELNNQLDTKNRAYMEACEERNHFKSEYNTLRPAAGLLEQCALLLNCEPGDIISRLREVQNSEMKCNHHEDRLHESQQTIKSLQQTLHKAEERLEQTNALEIQLEKARSYAEALETRLPIVEHVSNK